jgi:hypothetical protein
MIKKRNNKKNGSNIKGIILRKNNFFNQYLLNS